MPAKKLDKFWLDQIDRHVKLVDEARRNLHSIVLSGGVVSKDQVEAYIKLNDSLLELLDQHWNEIRECVENSFPSGLVFPRRDP